MKYELIESDRKSPNGARLYRVRATEDGTHAKKGELGGFIESAENLSCEGNAWVAKHAAVFDEAWVMDDALVTESAKVCGRAEVYDNACVGGRASVLDRAQVCDDALVIDNAVIEGRAWVGGVSIICGCSRLSGNVVVRGDSFVADARLTCGHICDMNIRSQKDVYVIDAPEGVLTVHRSGACAFRGVFCENAAELEKLLEKYDIKGRYILTALVFDAIRAARY
ncbi:hypothetical protein G4O51_11560 [Candidatus Bathyarchaeota archaeon A05DMB-2]|jgi:carbonic anhydrase/acetyltransferase-like protein (isoleucine patch superfamily)|nr:hypothetical protein [Candidatus Bathyarchaeota archaeon A05DMB-2]